MEPNDASLAASALSVQTVSRCLRLETKVWVKDVEFLSLYRFWRRVFTVVVSSIVFVPFISSAYMIQILWFSWPVFVAQKYSCESSVTSALEPRIKSPSSMAAIAIFSDADDAIACLLNDCFNNTVSELSNLMI